MRNKNEIKVSIFCIAYNQEQYIEDALKGFISQKTNFKYELIINDDASTDKTAEIIEKYRKKYPNIIKPIYQKENQYSKTGKVVDVMDIIIPHMNGKYVAFCEGDDYWCDENKLQEQVDYLEQNKECSFCTHTYTAINCENNSTKINYIFKKNQKITLEEFLKDRKIFQTATILCRAKLIKSLPSFYYDATVADLSMLLYLLYKGYGYYINKNMSYYRYMASGSWTLKNKNDISFKIKNHEMTKNIYKGFNKYTKNKYAKEIKEYLLHLDFNFAISINDFKELEKSKYKSLYKNLSIKEKIKIFFKKNKFIYNMYKKIKYKE